MHGALNIFSQPLYPVPQNLLNLSNLLNLLNLFNLFNFF